MSQRILVDRRSNHLSSQERSAAGKLGRIASENAKEASWWKRAMQRCEVIVERERQGQLAGTGVDVIRWGRHAYRTTLKAVKF